MRRPCMTAEEHADWQEQASKTYNVVSDPCTDCIASFALEMRAQGKCDGVPLGWEDDDDQQHRTAEGYAVAVAASAIARDRKKREFIKATVELTEQGLTIAQIAKRLGIAKRTVTHYRSEARLEKYAA